MLRTISQFTAAVLVLAVVAMPAMACMVPDRQMTAEEQACCKKMAHACELSAMPASHSCCQHPVAKHALNVSNIRPVYHMFSVASVEGTFVVPNTTTRAFVAKFESPPEDPLKISPVLRI